MSSQTHRLMCDWLMVSPKEVRPSVEKWGFHLETAKQFDRFPGIAPERTAYFEGVKAYKKTGGQLWADCTTDQAIVAYVEAFRRLFRRIRMHGYKMGHPIWVDIDQEGNIIVYDGHHRSSIAVFLDLNISARVRWRHPDWVARVNAGEDA